MEEIRGEKRKLEENGKLGRAEKGYGFWKVIGQMGKVDQKYNKRFILEKTYAY
jgi:hypothetical protein